MAASVFRTSHLIWVLFWGFGCDDGGRANAFAHLAPSGSTQAVSGASKAPNPPRPSTIPHSDIFISLAKTRSCYPASSLAAVASVQIAVVATATQQSFRPVRRRGFPARLPSNFPATCCGRSFADAPLPLLPKHGYQYGAAGTAKNVN